MDDSAPPERAAAWPQLHDADGQARRDEPPPTTVTDKASDTQRPPGPRSTQHNSTPPADRRPDKNAHPHHQRLCDSNPHGTTRTDTRTAQSTSCPAPRPPSPAVCQQSPTPLPDRTPHKTVHSHHQRLCDSNPHGTARHDTGTAQRPSRPAAQPPSQAASQPSPPPPHSNPQHPPHYRVLRFVVLIIAVPSFF